MAAAAAADKQKELELEGPCRNCSKHSKRVVDSTKKQQSTTTMAGKEYLCPWKTDSHHHLHHHLQQQQQMADRTVWSMTHCWAQLCSCIHQQNKNYR
jgi:hypothetical protein